MMSEYMGKKEREYARSLSLEDFEDMMFDGAVYTADGCLVEPDGNCPHGYSSPLLLIGII